MVRGKTQIRKLEDKQDEPVVKHARIKKRTVYELPLPELSNVFGNLLACGNGDFGQLGLGEDVTEKTRPALVDSVKNVVNVCAGGMHTLCLTRTGEIYSFGCNDEGALGRETTEDGAEFIPKIVDLPGKAVKISAGDSHSACLLEDGRIFAWGSFRDSHGNMGLTLEGNKRLPVQLLKETKSVDIASGTDHLVILTINGKIFTVGCAEQGQLGRISVRSASGESRRGKTELLQPSMVFLKKGKLVQKIWASRYCTFFQEKDSEHIYGFGLNNYNQLGLDKSCDPVFVPKLTKFLNVKDIAGGQHHTLILKNDGKCFAVGRKEYGRLGLGDVEKDIEDVTLVKHLENFNIVSIACGDLCSFAVRDNGEVYAWGMGSNQQLGIGSDDDQNLPQLLTGVQVKNKKVLKVSSGGQHTVFIVESNITSSSVNGNAAKQTKIEEKVPDSSHESDIKSSDSTNETETTSQDDDNIQSNQITSSKKGGGKKRAK